MKNTTGIHKAGLIVFALLFCFTFYVHFVAGNATPDKELSFYTAKAWLEGKQLYTQLFTVQPPLIYFLYSVPVYLSLHMPVMQDYHFLTLLMAVMIGKSIWIGLQIMRGHPQFAGNLERQLEFCLLLGFVFVIFQHPMDFGDREHIFLVLTTPYLLRWMPSTAGAPLPLWMRMMIGIMAGIGFSIKPHCLAVLGGINLASMLFRRRADILFSIENILIYLIGGGYALSVWLFFPQYITVVLPMVFATYSAASAGPRAVFYGIKALLIFCVTFADFRPRYDSPFRRDIYYLLLVCVSFLLYVAANNGWGYTWDLLDSVLLILTGFVLWECLYLKAQKQALGEPFKPFLFGARACMINFAVNAILSIMISYGYGFNNCGHYFTSCKAGKVMLEQVRTANDGKPLERFGAISMDFGVWSYLNRATGAEWDTRFNHLWMLPKFLIAGPEFAAKHQWILHYVEDSLAEDMERYKPELMFVDDTDDFYTYRHYVDMAAFFSASPRFAEAWSHYRYVTKIHGLYAFDAKQHNGYFVYKRIH
ncbi:MAG TPA: hypothetical protein VFT64_06295 [Rickettsiales bacterium]|nr:hypothetical protein [Rickettsiales bacterium]